MRRRRPQLRGRRGRNVRARRGRDELLHRAPCSRDARPRPLPLLRRELLQLPEAPPRRGRLRRIRRGGDGRRLAPRHLRAAVRAGDAYGLAHADRKSLPGGIDNHNSVSDEHAICIFNVAGVDERKSVYERVGVRHDLRLLDVASVRHQLGVRVLGAVAVGNALRLLDLGGERERERLSFGFGLDELSAATARGSAAQRIAGGVLPRRRCWRAAQLQAAAAAAAFRVPAAAGTAPAPAAAAAAAAVAAGSSGRLRRMECSERARHGGSTWPP